MGEATEQPDLQEDTQKGKYLTFSIGNDVYGIEIRCVTEIIKLQPVTAIPQLPEYVIGIINLRGQIIPVMDIRIRFQKERREYTDRTCIIVVDIEGMSIGLIVDSVAEVLSIPEVDIVQPPGIMRERNQYIDGIGKVDGSVKLLINVERLIGEEDKEKLLMMESGGVDK